MLYQRAFDWAILVLYSVLGLGGLLLQLRGCARTGAFRGVLRRVVDRSRHILQILGILNKQQDLETQREVQRRRDQLAAQFCRAAAALVSVLMVLSAGLVLKLRIVQRTDTRALSAANDVFFTLLAIALLAVSTIRRLHTGRALIASYLVMMIFLLGLAWSNTEIESRTRILIGRFVCGVLVLRCVVSGVSNVLFSAVMLAFGGWATSPQSVMLEVITACGLLVVDTALEVSFVAKASSEAAEQYARGQHAATSALLGLVCDAVIELDSGLCFKGGAGKLSKILFMDKELLGVRLETIVAEGDRSVLDANMVGEKGKQANMFHVRLRDAWGNLVPMQLFHVAFLGPEGQLRHIVGVVEHRDEARGDGLGTSSSDRLPSETVDTPKQPRGEDSALLALPGFPQPAQPHSSARRRPRPPKMPPAAPGSVPELPAGAEAEELAVDVLIRDGLPVVGGNEAWARRYPEVTTLCELLPFPVFFQQWLSRVFEDLRSGSKSPSLYRFGLLQLGQGLQKDLCVISVFFPAAVASGTMEADYQVTVFAKKGGGGSSHGESRSRSSRGSRGSRGSAGGASLASQRSGRRRQEAGTPAVAKPRSPRDPAFEAGRAEAGSQLVMAL